MLKLTDVRTPLKFEIQKGTHFFLRDFLPSNSNHYNIDFDVYLNSIDQFLQRPFVWTLKQKQELILSVLKGITLPPISVCIDDTYKNHSRGEKTFKIIDGKQRLSTLIDFMENNFYITVNGQDYFYKDFDDSAAYVFKTYSTPFDIAYEDEGHKMSDEDLIKWFDLINFAGTPQDSEHIKSLKQKLK